MREASKRVALRFLIRQAGGLELGGDPAAQLPKMTGLIRSLSDKDIAYGTYVFEYIAGMTHDPRIKKFAGNLGEVYARRFAEWLAYAFVQRAARERSVWSDDLLRELAFKIHVWLTYIPEILTGSYSKDIDVPEELMDRIDLDVLNRIELRVLRLVEKNFRQQPGKKAALNDLPVTYDDVLGYVIPFSPEAYQNDRLLRDLGFEWQPYRKLWYSDTVTPAMISKLPQIKGVRPPPIKTITAPSEVNKFVEWYAWDWLPNNIDRLNRIFNTYSRSTTSFPLDFHITYNGKAEVKVTPGEELTPKNVSLAVFELRQEYEDEPRRKPWIIALDTYEKLKRVKGVASIKLIDFANNLEHSNGSMLEHMPDHLRSWYPAFLDFKFTADILQMVKRIKNQDLRELADALLPAHDQMRRLRSPQRDQRTLKGIVLEIMAQPGRHDKQVKYDEMAEQYPELADEIYNELRNRRVRVKK